MDVARSQRGFVGALRRRARLVYATALTTTIVAALVSLALPPLYPAEVTLELGAAGGTGGDFQARATQAAERMLSHDAMAHAAKAADLEAAFADLAADDRADAREALLTKLRAGATAVCEPTDGKHALVHLTARSDDADTALRLVKALQDFAEHIPESDSAAKPEAAVAAAKRAADAADAAFQAAAKTNADYAAEHHEFLDGAGAKLQATRDQKKQLKDVTIAALEKKKAELDALLSEEKETAVILTRRPDPDRLASMNETIAEAHETLQRLTVTEKRVPSDPEVIAQRARLTTLDDAKKRLIAEAPTVETRQPNEQWAQLSKARIDAQSQIDAAQRQIKLLAAAEKEQEELARRTPEFEAKQKEFAAAEASAKETLDLKKTELTKAEEALEAQKKRGSFTVSAVAPPVKPSNSAGPGALLIALGGLVLGALIGAGSAFAIDRMDHSFRSEGTVAAFLGVPTIGVVQTIETPAEAGRRRALRRRDGAKLAGLALLAVIVVATSALGGAQAAIDLVRSVVG